MFKWLFGSKDDTPAVEGTKELLVVRRRVQVPPDRAFAVFVDEFQRWWPREYTFSGDKLASIQIEPKMGGRCTETTTDGATLIWGMVLSFHRPDHLVIAWQIGPERQMIDNEAGASRVDVRFVAADDGKATEVVVVHRDFPRHGDGWEAYKAKMSAKDGWPRLIDLYAKATASGG